MARPIVRSTSGGMSRCYPESGPMPAKPPAAKPAPKPKPAKGK